MSYTASGNIARIKTKGFVSTASSLMDPEVLEWLDDSLRSGVVPFLKAVRDEWFVSGSEDVTPDANARIPLPNSVASTIRLINWMNNGTPVPLARIEPENGGGLMSDKKTTLIVVMRNHNTPGVVDRVRVEDIRNAIIMRDGTLVVSGVNRFGGDSIKKAFAAGTWLTCEEVEE